MRTFLDANFLVAAGFRPAGDYRKALARSQDEFVTSEHLLDEVRRNLQRLSVSPEPFISILRRSFLVTSQFDVLPVGLPLEGSGDRQALAEAIGAACELFVTDDEDFANLFGQRIKGVLVVRSRDYVRSTLHSSG
ncbi:MAG: hypothetical protein ACOYON_06600 [Fimbriimonas sp.]